MAAVLHGAVRVHHASESRQRWLLPDNSFGAGWTGEPNQCTAGQILAFRSRKSQRWLGEAGIRQKPTVPGGARAARDICPVY